MNSWRLQLLLGSSLTTPISQFWEIGNLVAMDPQIPNLPLESVSGAPWNGLVLIAALATASTLATLPDNGFIGGRQPYEPARLNPATLNVRVDNPIPRYNRNNFLVIASWPREPDPLPETTIKLPQGQPLDNPRPRYAPANNPVIAAWPREPDPLPITSIKLPQAYIPDNPTPRYSRSLPSIIASWPTIPDPLPETTIKLTPPASVDNPPAGRGIDRILAQTGNWGYETVPEYPPKLIQPKLDNPPPSRRIDHLYSQSWIWEQPPVPQYPPKLIQPRADFVRRQNAIPAAVIESWFAPPQYLPTFTKFVPPTPLTQRVPFTRFWLPIVSVTWDRLDGTLQRSPQLPVNNPPVPPPDCGHLFPSISVGANLTEAISKAGATRSSASKAGSMKPSIPC